MWLLFGFVSVSWLGHLKKKPKKEVPKKEPKQEVRCKVQFGYYCCEDLKLDGFLEGAYIPTSTPSMNTLHNPWMYSPLLGGLTVAHGEGCSGVRWAGRIAQSLSEHQLGHGVLLISTNGVRTHSSQKVCDARTYKVVTSDRCIMVSTALSVSSIIVEVICIVGR